MGQFGISDSRRVFAVIGRFGGIARNEIYYRFRQLIGIARALWVLNGHSNQTSPGWTPNLSAVGFDTGDGLPMLASPIFRLTASCASIGSPYPAIQQKAMGGSFSVQTGTIQALICILGFMPGIWHCHAPLQRLDFKLTHYRAGHILA
ncbi:hypothetical protein [Mesorhizobium sp. B2-4-14]|uniref:hypothetical protein n=1 Tax=Mesorhizobium sp. B2-4-14 TaxID=2589935 RepID=UPI0015E39D07|nr:hypothetical protein [Mesorhizobium sp. B2-4-14]